MSARNLSEATTTLDTTALNGEESTMTTTATPSGSFHVREFAYFGVGDEPSVAYRAEPVAWALSRNDGAALPPLQQQTERTATFAVALGVDDEFDLVMVDENNGDALEDLDRAIGALTNARRRLSELLEGQR